MPADEPVPAAAPASPQAPPADNASGGMRVVALIAAIALFFGAAVMYVVVANPDDTPRCEELAEQGALFGECYDVGETAQTLGKVFAAPAGVFALAAAVVGLFVAATGRRGDLMLRLSGIAIALAVVSVVVNRL
jgi:hypothetical protein